jgi:sporulation protein YlmC with PRC-barrel domain
LADVVIDAGARRVTHLVVAPSDRPELGRLVGIDQARGGDRPDAPIVLTCTAEELERLEAVHHTAYLQLGEKLAEGPDRATGIEDVSSLASYEGFAPGGIDTGALPTEFDSHVTASYDLIPRGGVEIRRRSAVTSADGHHLGHVDGFVLDDDHRIIELVLVHGHLWGKRDIHIPMTDVATIDNDELVLAVPRDEVAR